MELGLQSEKKITRKIWIFWDSGLTNAPELVRVCHEAWRRHNPSWEVVLLSSETLDRYLEPGEFLTRDCYPSIQKFSNHVRLLLLKKYGGLWVDADLLCLKPLDSWLPDVINSEMFLFSRPSADRTIANWLIYASVNDPHARACVSKIESEFNSYYGENHFRTSAGGKSLTHLIQKLLIKLAQNSKIGPGAISRFWTSTFVKRILRITPYFAFHYIVDQLLMTEPEIMEPVRRMTKIPAHGPLVMREKLKNLEIWAVPQPWFSESLTVSKLNYRQMTDETYEVWGPVLSNI